MNEAAPTSSKLSIRWAVTGLFIVVIAVVAFRFRDVLRPPPPAEAPPARLPVEKSEPERATKGTATVQNRDGSTRDLSKAPGKLLILHFWATWCPPCVDELPGLVAYWRELKKEGKVELVAVSVDDSWQTVDGWLKQRGAADLPVALDPRRQTAFSFGTRKFPETYVLSPEGKVVTYVMGPVDWTSKETHRRIQELTDLAAPKT